MDGIELTNACEWGRARPSIEVKAPVSNETIMARIDGICKKEFESIKSVSFSAFFEANFNELAIGILVGAASFICLGQFDAVLVHLGGGLGGGSVGPIDYAIKLAQMPTTLLIGSVKVAFFALMAFAIPYLEEFAFRGVLYDLMGGDLGDKVDKALRVLGNAFLFALYHIPAMLPHVSVLLFLEIFILGAILATLRATTEGRVASTAAHITYNSLIFATIFALA